MSDDNFKGVAKFVSWNSSISCPAYARKEIVELNSLRIKKIINMYVEVPGDEEFVWNGSGIWKGKRKIG